IPWSYLYPVQRDLIRSLPVGSASGLAVLVAASPAAPFSTPLGMTITSRVSRIKIQKIVFSRSIRAIGEGMRFVQEVVLKNSGGSGCRKDGKRVTISAVGMLKPAGAYGRCSWIAIWSDSPYLRMSTGAKHLHGDRPAYLSACKR